MPNDLASLSLTVKRLCSLAIPIKAGSIPFTDARSWLRSPIIVLGIIAIPAGAVAILRGALQAKYFGAGWAVDAFTVAQALSLFLVNVVGTSLGLASVPAVAHITASTSHRDANQFIYSLLALGAVKFIALSLIIVLIGPIYVAMIGGSFDDQTRRLSIELLSVFACFFLFSASSAQISAVLNYLGSYATAAAAQVLVSAGGCLALILFQDGGNIELLAWGLVLGAAAQCTVLAADLVRRIGLPIRLSFAWAPLGRFGREYLLLIAAAGIMSVTTFVDLYMAGELGQGSVATLAYGAVVPMLAVAFVSSIVSGPSLSLFSAAIAGNRFRQAREEFNRYVLSCLILGAVPTAILIGLTPSLVHALFAHGSISSADAVAIGHVQSLLLLQLPFYAAGIVAVRMLTALQLNRVIMFVASMNLALKIGLNLLLLPLLGVAGISLGTSTVYVFSLACCWLLATRALSKRRVSTQATFDQMSR